MTLNEIREVLNGIWAVSSFCVLCLLIAFIVTKRTGQADWDWRWNHEGWWRDEGVQVAAALTVLVAGHFTRSAPQWIQFIYLNDTPGIDTTSAVYRWATYTFIPATALILVGKILSVWAVAPSEWSWWFAGAVLLLSCTIPLLVHWLV